MCAPKAPKVDASASKPPDPAIIRNPYFDGALQSKQARVGRNSLRIDPGSAHVGIPTPQPQVPVTPTGPAPRPGLKNRLLAMPNNPGGFVGILWNAVHQGAASHG